MRIAIGQLSALLLCLLQAITALKKGAYLLKYGRRGKPKFCPFRLANVSLMFHDECLPLIST